MVAIMTARKWLLRVAISIFSLAVLIYGGVCVWLMSNQHRLIFGAYRGTVPILESLGPQPKIVQIGTLGSLPLTAWSISSLPADSAGNRWILFSMAPAALAPRQIHHKGSDPLPLLAGHGT